MQSDTDFPYAMFSINKESTIKQQRLKIKIDQKVSDQKSKDQSDKTQKKAYQYSNKIKKRGSSVQRPIKKFHLQHHIKYQLPHQRKREINAKYENNSELYSNSTISESLQNSDRNQHINNSDSTSFYQDSESDINLYIDEIEYLIEKMKKSQGKSRSNGQPSNSKIHSKNNKEKETYESNININYHQSDSLSKNSKSIKKIILCH